MGVHALPNLRKVCFWAICVDNGRLCVGGGVMFLVDFFNIVSAFFVVEWMSGGKKTILARVVFGTKWGFVHNWLFACLCCFKRNFMLNGRCLMRISCYLRQNALRFGAK